MRSGKQSLLHFSLDGVGWPEAQKLLDTEGVQYDCMQNTERIFSTAETIKSNAELFRKLGESVKPAYKRSEMV